jgi:hypothetical protein
MDVATFLVSIRGVLGMERVQVQHMICKLVEATMSMCFKFTLQSDLPPSMSSFYLTCTGVFISSIKSLCFSKKKILGYNRAGGEVQVVERLPSKCKHEAEFKTQYHQRGKKACILCLQIQQFFSVWPRVASNFQSAYLRLPSTGAIGMYHCT